MPKMGAKGLTTTQEHILLALDYLRVTAGEGDIAYFEQKAIARVMSGRWTKYRREAIEDLAKKGWINSRESYSRRYYRINPDAVEALKVRFEPDKFEKQTLGENRQKALGV